MSKISILVCGLLLILSVEVNLLYAQELTLPLYSLTIDSVDLNALNGDVWSDRTYPAQVEFNGENYDCRVRYRGATGRAQPKKSWKLYFEDQGPNGENETNLNSEYRDMSLSRNYLSIVIARLNDLSAPKSRFISLKVNDIYQGVFIDLEQVDQEYFESRNIDVKALFKCGSERGYAHSARFAPPLKYEEFSSIYVLKEGSAESYNDLGQLTDFIQYSDSATFEQIHQRLLNVEEILTYFAVQYCIENNDGYAKNIYLAHDNDDRYSLVPWDCDAVLGNQWEGNWVEGYAFNLGFGTLQEQALYRRLINDPDREEMMVNAIHNIAQTFESVADTVDAVWDYIRHDVQIDTFKRGTNEQFELERERLLGYLSDRAEALLSIERLYHDKIRDIRVDSDYLVNLQDTIRIEVVLDDETDEANVVLFDGDNHTLTRQLLDDGQNGDEQQGDFVYTVEVALSDRTPPYYFCCYAYTQNGNISQNTYQPPAGWFNFQYFALSLPVIRVDSLPPQPDDIEIGSVHVNPETDIHYFGLINSSDHAVNLSGCVVRIGSDYRMLRIRELPAIDVGDTLFITNRMAWAEVMLPDKRFTGELRYSPTIDDTISLQTSSGIALSSLIVEHIEDNEEFVGDIVINEINYHSSDLFDPDDWIELYARNGDHDLSNWYICDDQDDHRYMIPAGTELLHLEYLIIAKDPEAFNQAFPNVENVCGGFEFGFSADGDQVRLYNPEGRVEDWVAYDDDAPWPEAADGTGSTLELVKYDLLNYNSQNWDASLDTSYHGSPGGYYVNFNKDDDIIVTIPVSWEIESIYPIPFNGQVNIRFSTRGTSNVSFSIYDIMGRTVKSISKRVRQIGSDTIVWDGNNDDGLPVSSGLYFIRLDGSQSWKRIVLIR